MAARMAPPLRRRPRSAGVFLTLLPLGGLATGAALGQPSIGLVVGIAAAVLIVLLFWLVDRR